MYINHPDSDKGNLIIAYVTLDGKFCDPIHRSILIHIYSLLIYLLMCEHLGRCIKRFKMLQQYNFLI